MFELPPPPLSGFAQKYPSYTHPTTQPTPTATTLTSVGNLLTPPSHSSADGLSPGSSALTTGSSLSNPGAMPSYATNGASMWAPPSSTTTTTYGFHQSAPLPQFSHRPLYSPSLNSIIQGNNSPTAGDSLPPPPPYELPQYHPSTSMSAPSLQTLPQQQQMNGNAMMRGQTPTSASVTQPSPVHAQEAFSRPPPTPTYYNGSQPSSTPQQASFPYSSGPSPIQQSPVSAGGPLKMSPVNGHGSMPPLHHHQPTQYSHQRPYSYSGPVLSNINNPGGQLALVGGMQHGMMGQGYNSGHAASMHHMYGHQQPNPHNDRPFRCDQCPQSFNRNHDLKRHKRIHLAVKPFPCGHCDKSFSRKDALKRHVLVKGCGKAQATAEVKEIDGSVSPKSESSPVPVSA
ncbi:hypothetical protein LTR65_007679 [Meristemomyces frigidus]